MNFISRVLTSKILFWFNQVTTVVGLLPNSIGLHKRYSFFTVETALIELNKNVIYKLSI